VDELDMPNLFRKKMIQGLKPNDTFTLKRTFTKQDTHFFGDLTRDYNPIHYDERWTTAKGFDDQICHGLLVGSMICEFGGQVGWLATSMNFKFIKPIYFNDTVECTITLISLDDKGKAEAEAIFMNQNNLQVCHAKMKGRLPLRHEKQILNQMVEEGDPSNKISDETYLYD
jgi:3-hydroxybutyryl-CoA dehydratase